MSELEVVQLKVEVERNGTPVATLTPERVNITREVTEAVGTGEIEALYSNINGIPEIGDQVKIYIGRKGEGLIQKFFGNIVTGSTIEVGKEEYVNYSLNELPDFNIRTVTLKKNASTLLSELISSIVAPLVNDNIISLSISPSITGSVSFEGVDKEPIFPTLQDVCLANTLDFYLDFGRTLQVYRKIDSPVATYTLDQTNPNCIRINRIEYVEDLERVRNTITVYGEFTRVEPNGNYDYWTDSTIGWKGEVSKYAAGWESITPETVSPAIAYGNYYVRFRATSSQKDITGFRGTLDLGMNIDVSSGAELVFTLKINAIQKIVGQPDRWGLRDLWKKIPIRVAKVQVMLIDQNGNSIGVRDIEQPEGDKEHRLKMGTGLEKEWGGILPYMTPEWIVSKIGFKVWTRYYGKGAKVQSLDIGFDKLYFDSLECSASYSVTDSINKYGLRPYERDIDRRGLDTDEKCLEKAKKIIDAIAYPETSIRELEVFGDKRINIGEKVLVRTDRIGPSTFYVRRVTDEIDRHSWITTMSLSTSEVLPPEKSREVLEVDMHNKLRKLEKRIDILERMVGTYENIELPSFTLPTTIDFQDLAPDWTTFLAGATNWSLEQIKQWLGAGQEAWNQLVQGLGIPWLNLIPSELGINLVYNGDFEIDSDGDKVADGWTFTVGAGNPSKDLSTVYTKEGRYSAQIQHSSTSDWAYFRSEYITVEDDFNYVLRLNAFTDVSGGATIQVTVQFYDKDKINRGSHTVYLGNITYNVWQEISGIFQAHVDGYEIKYVRIDLSTGTGFVGSVYFDSVWLLKQFTWKDIVDISGVFEAWANFVKGLGVPWLKLFPSWRENILYNGEFELDSDNDNKPDGWSLISDNGSTGMTSTISAEGKQCVWLINGATGNAYINNIELLPVDDDAYYVLRIKARSDSTPSYFQLIAYLHDRNGTYRGSKASSMLSVGTSWQEYTFKFQAHIDGYEICYARVYAWISTANNPKTYFDSFSMIKEITIPDVIGQIIKFGTHVYDSASNFYNALSDVSSFTDWVTNFWGGKKIFTDIISATWNNFWTSLSTKPEALTSAGTLASNAVKAASQILDGIIPFAKVTSKFAWESLLAPLFKPQIGESTLGYYITWTGSGGCDVSKGHFRIWTGTAGGDYAYFHDEDTVINFDKNPWFKTKLYIIPPSSATIAHWDVIGLKGDNNEMLFVIEEVDWWDVKVRGRVLNSSGTFYTSYTTVSAMIYHEWEAIKTSSQVEFYIDGSLIGAISQVPTGNAWFEIYASQTGGDSVVMDWTYVNILETF